MASRYAEEYAEPEVQQGEKSTCWNCRLRKHGLTSFFKEPSSGFASWSPSCIVERCHGCRLGRLWEQCLTLFHWPCGSRAFADVQTQKPSPQTQLNTRKKFLKKSRDVFHNMFVLRNARLLHCNTGRLGPLRFLSWNKSPKMSSRVSLEASQAQKVQNGVEKE